MEAQENRAPQPLTAQVENGVVGRIGRATFDREELRRFVNKTTAPSFVVQDVDGEIVGIAHVDLIRELFAEQPEGMPPNSLLDSRASQTQSSLNG